MLKGKTITIYQVKAERPKQKPLFYTEAIYQNANNLKTKLESFGYKVEIITRTN